MTKKLYQNVLVDNPIVVQYYHLMVEHTDETELRYLLSYLGIEISRETSDRFVAKCPNPEHSDRSPSWSMNKRTGQHYCFSCHFKGNAVTLAKELSGQPLYRILGKDAPTAQNRKRNSELSRSYTRPTTKVKRRKPIQIEGSEYDPYQFSRSRSALRRLHITRSFVDHFDITYMKYGRINGTEFADRLLFKVYEGGKLRNIEGRGITDDQHPKVLYPYKGDTFAVTADTLWNADSLDRGQPLVLCEGIKDTIKIWRYVTQNVTSVFGNRLAERQRELISQFPYLIVFADNDEGGEALIDQIDELIDDREFYVAIPPQRGQDPADMTRSELQSAIEHPIEAVDYFLRVEEA